MWKWIKRNIIYFALAQVAVAIISSLYLSYVLHLNPCLLCWYQRIIMYPLAIIIIVGIWRKINDLEYLILPFTIIGLCISFYHNLLQYGVIKEKIVQCSIITPCVSSNPGYLGFITIPFLSFVAFTFITVCMIIDRKEKTKK